LSDVSLYDRCFAVAVQEGPSAAAIGGIAFGVVAGVVLIVLVAVFIYMR